MLRQEILTRHGRLVPLSVKVDKIVRLLISEQKYTVNLVASNLQLSPRTLQHKLKREDQRYQVIVDSVRLELATSYLEGTYLSIAAIAERLHFADSAVFSRFYRRHASLSPSDVIKSRRHGKFVE